MRRKHINLTNVRRIKDIEKAINIIYDVIDIPKIKGKEYRIDNVQATGILNLNHKGSSLKKICDALSRMQEEFNITSLSFESQKQKEQFNFAQKSNFWRTMKHLVVHKTAKLDDILQHLTKHRYWRSCYTL